MSKIRTVVSPTTPITAYLEPTLRCNLRCVHCYVEKEKPDPARELTRPEIQGLLRDLAGLGSMILVFTGGEIFLRRDLFDLLEDARRENFAVVLFTNGTLVGPAEARALYALAPLGVEVSLHAADPAVHDAITGVSGSHEQAIHGIRCLRQAGLRVKIKGSLMRANQGQYEDLIRLAGELGADYTFDPFLFPGRDHDPAPLSLRLDEECLSAVLNDARLVRDKAPANATSPLSDPDHRLCGAAANTVCISATGEVFPCIPMRIPAGNIRRESFRSIWNNSPTLTTVRGTRVRDLSDCAGCEHVSRCLRCSALALNEDGDRLGCSKLSRTLSGIRQKQAAATAA